jgi:hypothetical protein
VSPVSYNQAPTCNLTLDPSTPTPIHGWDAGGAPVKFISGGSDPNPGDVLTYAWDFDGDGTYGEVTDDKIDGGTPANPTHNYMANYTGKAWVKVTDPLGKFAICSIDVQAVIHTSKNIALRAGVAAADIALDHQNGNLYILYTDNTIYRYSPSDGYTVANAFMTNSALLTFGYVATTISHQRIDIGTNGNLVYVAHTSTDTLAGTYIPGAGLLRVFNTSGGSISGIVWRYNSVVTTYGLTTYDPASILDACVWSSGDFKDDACLVDGVYYSAAGFLESDLTMVRQMDDNNYVIATGTYTHLYNWWYTPMPPYTGADRLHYQYVTGMETVPTATGSGGNVWVLEGTGDYRAQLMKCAGAGWPAPDPTLDTTMIIGNGTQGAADTQIYNGKDITRNKNGAKIFILDQLTTGPTIKVWTGTDNPPVSKGHVGSSTSIAYPGLRIEGSDYSDLIFVLHGNAGATTTSYLSIFTPSEIP